MKKRLFYSAAMGIALFCMITISYQCTGRNGSNTGKNSPELFCGKQFTSKDYQEEMDMQRNYLTILKCDGTYTSELNWKANSAEGERIYNNNVGSSKGNFKSYAGTWKIITDSIPAYLASQITTYENFESNHMPKGQTTVIKYHSSGGRTGYAYIYVSSDRNEIILTPVPSALEATSHYEDDDLHMYFGRY